MSENIPTGGFSRRRFLELGAGAAAAASLAACGGKSADDAAQPKSTGKFTGGYDGPEVTLSYWNGFTGGDGPFMKQLVADFMKENPKIKIKANTVEWAQYYQRMPAAVTAGKGPDVGVMHLDQLATNAARKVIVPVDDLVDAAKLTEDDFTADIWNAAVYKDARYGVPLDVHSLAMYYNTDSFEKAGVSEAPTDEASLMEALDKLKAGANKTPFWMPTRWPAHLMFLSLIWQNGGEPYAEDGSKATFDSDAGVKALEWMRSVVDKGYSPKNVAQDSQYVSFKSNKVDVTWDGIWQINDLKANKSAFDIAPIPKIGETEAVWANSHQFYISKQGAADENKFQASKQFIVWMSEKSADWAQAGMIPARKSVRETPEVADSTQGPIVEKIDSMKFLPPVPGLGDVQAQTLEIAVADGVLGKKQPADALKSAATKATQLMEENLKKFGA